MRPVATETTSRREFLRSSARYGWLLALGGTLAWLSTRRTGSATCSSSSPCVTCPAFSDCVLPQAWTNRISTAGRGDLSNPTQPSGESTKKAIP
jgi:hypothetical protein